MEVTNYNREFRELQEWRTAIGSRFVGNMVRSLPPDCSYRIRLAEEFDGKLVVGKCDVEENDDIAMEFGVRNIPTILFFKGGQLVDKFVGAASKATLTEKFQALL